MIEFVAFPKIKKVDAIFMSITQKIHGSNSAIHIFKQDAETSVRCQSRNRFVTPDDDNFGFAAFVEENKAEIIEKLGLGLHFGEWAGPGINSSEGLKEKTFVLFDFYKFPPGRPLPPRTMVVPVLYQGRLDHSQINTVMEDLKTNGSKLVPGVMRPEGIVVSIGGVPYKKVFSPEETQWTSKKKPKTTTKVSQNFDHLLQTQRLAKLLSKDSAFLENYPSTLSTIVKEYIIDLEEEGQITGTVDEIKSIKKNFSGPVYGFVKEYIEEIVCAS